MRVLYDISVLGLAWLYRQSRGGSYRVDLHLCQALLAARGCDLVFCANHSAVAYHGCEAFLRQHPRLGRVPLLGPRSGMVSSALRNAASHVHRRARTIVGSHELPPALRRVAAVLDRRLHPPVSAAVDVLHTPLALPRQGPGDPPARFLTIFDLAYLRFPELYGPAHRRPLTTIIQSVQPRDHIVTASRYVREELLDRGVASPDRIHAVPLAADPALFSRCTDPGALAAVRQRYGVPEGPYVLSVNSPDPRKNVPHAIHAFAAATRQSPGRFASLVLTGNTGHGSDRIERALAAYPELHGRVVLTGYVLDEDLAALYSGARVFVYPSIYEGFGLPPLEAMQCGTPVITLDTPSLDEVVGDGGVRVPPADATALAAAMLDLAGDGPRRTELQARGLAQASRFDWDRSAGLLLDAYRAALGA